MMQKNVRMKKFINDTPPTTFHLFIWHFIENIQGTAGGEGCLSGRCLGERRGRRDFMLAATN